MCRECHNCRFYLDDSGKQKGTAENSSIISALDSDPGECLNVRPRLEIRRSPGAQPKAIAASPSPSAQNAAGASGGRFADRLKEFYRSVVIVETFGEDMSPVISRNEVKKRHIRRLQGGFDR